MDYILIGKLVNTHGIKGEVKILSDFERKDLVFKENFNLFIGPNKEKFIIDNYRHHKIFDMVTLKGINNINDILRLKGLCVYINRSDLNLKANEYLITDLISFEVLEDKQMLGKVIDISYNSGNNLLCVKGTKDFYIPINDHFIKKVDLEKQVIEVLNAKDLII